MFNETQGANGVGGGASVAEIVETCVAAGSVEVEMLVPVVVVGLLVVGRAGVGALVLAAGAVDVDVDVGGTVTAPGAGVGVFDLFVNGTGVGATTPHSL